MKWKHRIFLVIGTAIAMLVLLVAGAMYALQTSWFKQNVRERVISAVQQATGGRVEIGSFDYNWRTLNAEFRNFVVHGTEPPTAQPLFRADSIRVGLKIVSLLSRDVDVASLIVARPQIYILVRADGTTNIPSPQLGRRRAAHTIQDLLELKIRRFELRDGTVDADSHWFPLNVSGQRVALALTYDRRAPRYRVTVSSRKLEVNGSGFQSLPLNFEMHADLERNRVTIQKAVLASSGSRIQMSGPLNDFADPKLDLRVEGTLAAGELAPIWHFRGLSAGTIFLNGAAHYRQSEPIKFNGKLSGHNLAYRSKLVSIVNADFQADASGDPHQLTVTHFALAALGGRVTGEAKLNQSGAFGFAGTITSFSLQNAERFLPFRFAQWGGVASGPLQIQAMLANPIRSLALHGDLHIVPARTGAPVSGDVDFSYNGQTGRLQFGASHLSLPDTRLSFSGEWGASLQVALDSTDLKDWQPVLSLLTPPLQYSNLPVFLPNGSAHFDGLVSGPIARPRITGNLALTHFRAQEQTWDAVRSQISVSEDAIQFEHLIVDAPALHGSGDGRIGLRNWTVQADSSIQVHAQVESADLLTLAEYSKLNFPQIRGSISGPIDFQGSLADPQGRAQLSIKDASAFGERMNEIQLVATLSKNQLQLTQGRVMAGVAVITFVVIYNRDRIAATNTSGLQSWRTGDLQVKIDSNGFPLPTLAPVHKYEPGWYADFEIHARAELRITPKHIAPKTADGTLIFRNLVLNNVPYGNVTFKAATHDQTLTTSFSGDLRANRLTGDAQVQLANGEAKGELHFNRIDLATVTALLNPARANSLPVTGFIRGGITFEGPLQELDRIRGAVQLQDVQFSSALPVRTTETAKSSDFIFHNTGPVVFEIADGLAVIRDFRLGGRETAVTISGSLPFFTTRPLNVKLDGSVDMQVFQLFDPNVRSSGQSVVSASVAGTISNPLITGALELSNGAFSLKDLPNGLSAVNGSIKFDRDRATIKTLTAKTGGGDLALTGFVTFGAGPLVYRLEANAENIRLRYAGSISVTASSQLRLTGTSASGILSGAATVSRVVLNPNADVGNLLASVAAPAAAPGDQKDFLTGLQFDVRIESAPNLQLSTTLSRDVQAEVDLRLRGTPEHPVLLGNIVANQGDVRVFGTRYTINRGEINFVNAVRIEPVLDLDLRTEARGITVDITISGTLGKLNINYRSDPPLQPRDIIALLTVGRAPNLTSSVPNAQVTNDVSALQSGANTVLGQAISPASNRLSKLFGITNIKIDPLVQGTTNTPQARLTLEQQISKEITVTYITNLSQTSEQVFRVEWALSTHYSVVALRDDNGEFGIDLQYRKRFK